MKKSPRIIVGKVGSTYGVQGWLNIQSYTENASSILTFSPWYLIRDHREECYTLEEVRIHHTKLRAKLSGINSPEEARLLTGALIAVPRAQLPLLKKGEYYWSDLIGLIVFNKDGERLGEVIDLIETGSNDVLVVKGDKTFAIPYLLDRVILRIDLETQEIHVDWEPL